MVISHTSIRRFPHGEWIFEKTHLFFIIKTVSVVQAKSVWKVFINRIKLFQTLKRLFIISFIMTKENIWLERKENYMNLFHNIKKIRFYHIFINVMKLFFMSGGITLVITFLAGTPAFTPSKIMLISSRIFIFLFVLVSFYEISFCGCNHLYISEDTKCEHWMNKVVPAHEAGHALLTYFLTNREFIVEVNNFGGRVAQIGTMYDAEDVKKQILVYYAGPAAEELLLNELSFGSFGNAEADFEQAIRYIKDYLILTNRSVSKTFLDENLNSEIVRLSKEFYQEAYDMLATHLPELEKISTILTKKKTLSRKGMNYHLHSSEE